MYTLLLYFILIAGFASNENPQLAIEIQNIEVVEGYIRIGVFNSEEKFLKRNSTFKNYIIAVESNTEKIVIDDLPKGEYAFILYHDINSDGKMNRKLIGIPKEPFGFSNNVRPKLAKPTFEECKFVLEDNLELKIKLGYY